MPLGWVWLPERLLDLSPRGIPLSITDVNNFSGAAIQITVAGNDTITGCYLGADATGMAKVTPDGQRGNGIHIEGVVTI